MSIAQEEIFGPVQAILKWKDMDDVSQQGGTRGGG
jgi:acyl-CoA reductase-like NAD-dependent aldehyde dehydrogenase